MAIVTEMATGTGGQKIREKSTQQNAGPDAVTEQQNGRDRYTRRWPDGRNICVH